MDDTANSIPLERAREREKDALLAEQAALLERWTARLDLSRLSVFGVEADDIPRIVADRL